MTWTSPGPSTVDGATTGPERTLLHDHLTHHRHTLLNVCAGLTG
jgi:hypothetical protein